MPILTTRPERGITLLTVCNPNRRNALGPAEFQALAEAWTELAADPALRCVIVTGAGESAFCSGAQLDADFSGLLNLNDLVDRALLKTTVFPRPIVAA